VAEPAGARAARPRVRVRRRLGSMAALVAVVVGSGFALQRGLGPRAAPSARAEGGRSGAWFCPHGGGDGWKAWVWITNPGPDDVLVRVTTFGARGTLARSSFAVPSQRQAERAVPAVERGAATEVEYFGGWVAASAVVRSGEMGGSAAERCAPDPSRQWFVPDGTTAGGDSSFLVLMNPFGQDASFDVAITTDRRPAVRPGVLSPFVVKAGTSAALSLGDFVLQAPDEHLVTAEVHLRLGRVVAGGLTVSASGLRAETAIPAPATAWTLPAAGYAAPSDLALMNPGGRRADLEILAQGQAAQRALSGVGDLSLAPGQVRLLDLSSTTDSGIVVRSTNHVPVVATRRLASDRGDLATAPGAATAASRWVVLPGTAPNGGRVLLVIENPGATAADVTLVLIARDGPVAAPAIDRLTVGPARTVAVDLSEATGPRPISIVVTARGGTVVAGAASYPAGGDGFGVTLGEPMP
jgi:hypothetical protein